MAALIAGLPALLLAGACGAAAAVDADCRELRPSSEDDLLRYAFDTSRDELDVLPAGASYRLGAVRFVRQPVFEQADNRLERLANRYHVETRISTLETALTVAVGDRVDRRRLEEAERQLRRKPFLYDARVIPERLCRDTLDIAVVTRDTWTLLPTVAVESAGGDSSYGLGIADSNWFGSGRQFGVHYSSGADRAGIGASYFDPNVAGSRWTLGLSAADNDDGRYLGARVGRPFYALDVHRAHGLEGSEYVRDEGLYDLNEKLWAFRAESQSAELSLGFSAGVQDDVAHRWLLGVAYEADEFEFPASYPYEQPEDREKAYPFVAYQRVEDRFDKRVNLQRVQRTEDVNVGLRWGARLGWSSDRWGGRGERLLGRVGLADASWLGERHLLSYDGSVMGDYDLDDRRFEEVLAALQVSYLFSHADRFALQARAEFALANNLPADRQLLLGGDAGLRGYPTRYQSGDRRFLLTLEERYYSNLYPFQMFRVGAAAFVDVGRAWYEDDPPDWLPADRSARHYDMLTNAGVGLRIESTRTRRDLLLHVDFAVPLQDGPNVSDVEITVTARQSL